MDIWYSIFILRVKFTKLVQFHIEVQIVAKFWLVYYKEAYQELWISQHVDGSSFDNFQFTFDF